MHIRQTSKLVSRFGNTRVLGQAVPNPVFINAETTNAKDRLTQKDPEIDSKQNAANNESKSLLKRKIFNFAELSERDLETKLKELNRAYQMSIQQTG